MNKRVQRLIDDYVETIFIVVLFSPIWITIGVFIWIVLSNLYNYTFG